MKKSHPYSVRLSHRHATLLAVRAAALGTTMVDVIRNLIETLATDPASISPTPNPSNSTESTRPLPDDQ
jgi:hypothetical protein